MVRRLKLFWKLALIAVLTPVSVVLVVLVALQGTWALQSEYDHLYGQRYLSVVALEEANAHREALSGDLRLLAWGTLPPEERAARVARAREHEEALLAFIGKYKKEWATANDARFTRLLASQDELKLQQDESSALQLFDVAHAGYQPLRDHVVQGQRDTAPQLESSLARLAEAMGWLQALNRRFAALSNANAQSAFLQLRVLLPVLALGLSALGLMLAWWISGIIIEPVARLTRMTMRLSRGELELLEAPGTSSHIRS